MPADADAVANTPPVRIDRDGAVAVLLIDRPGALNALDAATAVAFLAACRTLAADDSVRAVVVGGAGRHFGVGGDLTAMRGRAAEVAPQLIEGLHGGLKLLAAMNAPVIARLQGAVAGGSMSLALGCDLAIAADTASFNLAYTRIGASCDGSSSWALPRVVGLRRAMEIALLSEDLGAVEAQRLGLVNRVVPAAELEAETMKLAQRLAAGPTLAYGRVKRLMRESIDRDFAGQLDAEAEAFAAGTRSADFNEGLEAFFAKRPPVFRGR